MSDFLTRAAETALGLRPVVRPLLASRYSSGQNQPVLEMDTDLGDPAQIGLESDPKSRELVRRSSETFPGGHAQTYETERPPAEVTPIPRDTAKPVLTQSAAADEKGSAYAKGQLEQNSQLQAPDDEGQDPSESGLPPRRAVSNSEVATHAQQVRIARTTEDPQTSEPLPTARPASDWSLNGVVSSIKTRQEAPSGETTIAEAAPYGFSSVFTEQRGLTDSAPAHRLKLDLQHSEVNAPEVKIDRPAITDREPVGRAPSVENGLTETSTAVGGDRFSVPNGLQPDHHPQAIRPSSIILRKDGSPLDRSSLRSGGLEPAARDAALHETASTPIVRVTIGRVEVRAAAPPSPPVETPAPPQPKMSLDEYLRQHNGRRR